ncbi:MAG: tRNA (N(6)-L-threonylcarbamoyladenosine(37)-C(2))-methylthiotransferase MtaB [Pirellulaceae bacterium]|nr:tRNA (N(6)-L-threonylcarbamoyladenosine(37)-C(2))-methylthiotransferase MtaB [Planctomycetaceae bacterium]MDP6467673.1 tRNA (N(6)-L-threonylcarbamoyladenosine(37)-C(2))-methylthiotransferase MtaB [Pirellulaceae bacterium]MDP6553982.1 tRNA (N(6)-L-threonylcarbamoyladenosine(37)-C(2))-methylthiotransferase MtaB [Pirellulaceae bacterium]MDP6717893.1 tRNA (N(6)-L-threonylcarbamoyladenosine(37)-C(2))-methylthiotransferase MtaB [Pirellulaceae bacterium]
MSATLRTVTLGCKVNQYETEFVREGLVGIGYRNVADDEQADLCVVNTCTVTNEGDAKSRRVIRRLARENPQTRIVVMGCYATRAPDEVASLPQVVEVVTDKRELPDLLGRFGVVDIPTGISGFGNRHRAYVKVQDGCLLRCSYCIIPKVRPQMYSRPMQPILDEVRRLQDNGYREIVLTGVHLGHYGVDWNRNKPKSKWTRLADLVEQLAKLEGDFRIRLSSIEATEVTRELLRVMREYENKVCPHLHVCLQSGSDRILRRMKRRWGAKMFVDRCGMAADALDKPAFSTDVIVGFPGETDADFEESCRVVGEVGFSKVHVFSFSPRRDTPAADMPEQLPKPIKSQRSRQMSKLEAELRKQYFERLNGTPLRVLVEGMDPESPGKLVGTSCRYAPVEFSGGTELCGSLVDVTAGAVVGDRIHGCAPTAPLEAV